ncbi:hypothetical protein EDD11_005267 [Mortierella claussenii]|nr:hypothetical protein EDD11_005267 [Mortierella claussenii]
MRCPPPSYVETDPMMIHVPNFADLVNKQAASYELIVDSLSSLNPDMIPKMKNKFKGQGRGFFGGRKGKGTVVNDQNGQGGAVLSSGHSDGGDTHGEDEDDPYGLAVHTQSHGLPLPLLLKRAELAVVDLKVLVRHSTLPEEAKQLLVEQLQLFHTRAKLTSRQLQFLQARANGCVDGLVIRNVYLMLELDRLEAQQELMKQGKGTGGMWDKMLYFFSGTHDLQVATSEYKLQHLYQTTMEDARNHVRDLIVQAQEVLQSLDTLDQALATIQEITTQETRQQKNAHDETLALLWSRLGGNRLERGFYRENLGLLKNLDSQRKATVGQIQAALWKLTDFEAEIGILREKIVDASVDATRDEGPLRVKAPSFEGQSDAGAGGGLGASSLRAHIQQIDMVTSRLKDRSFLADAIVKAQADKIPNMPGLTDDTASSESSP